MATLCWAAGGLRLVNSPTSVALSSRTARLLASAVVVLALIAALAACGPRRNSVYCPVCNMKVDPNGPWTAEIVYSDGTKLLFESPGDMIAFYHEPHKYKVSEAQKNLTLAESVLVRDYNAKARFDATEGTFVYRSRVNGPMGPDLVPFAKAEDGIAFAEANGGSVARFGELTTEMIRELRK